CSAIIFCHNSLRNSRFTFHIYYNMTSAIWQGTDKKYTHIFRVLTKTFHCSASICTLKSGSFLARIIVKKQYNNKRKEKRICADKSQYILIRKDCLNILPDKGRKILKKMSKSVIKINHTFRIQAFCLVCRFHITICSFLSKNLFFVIYSRRSEDRDDFKTAYNCCMLYELVILQLFCRGNSADHLCDIFRLFAIVRYCKGHKNRDMVFVTI